MKYLICTILFFFLTNISVFSQDKFIRHTVSKGETISEIAQQYNVKPSAIFELNPDAVKGIKIKSILLIPTTTKDSNPTNSKIANSFSEITHEVLPKETIYGIAKQHHITIEDVYKANPNLEKEGLKKGQVIKIPQMASDNLVLNKKIEKTTEIQEKQILENKISKKVADIEVLAQGIDYEVLPKETLFSIAKKYGISLSDLKKANSELGNKSLKVGQKIRVPVKDDAHSSLLVEKITEEKEVKTEKESAIISQVDIEVKNPQAEITHKVLPKETKYGIAKQYGLTIAELEKQNPNISKKLLVGSVLKINGSKSVEKEIAAENAIVLETAFVKEKSENKNINTVRDDNFVDQLISKASENIGTRYRSGGTTTAGFDCSGLMCYTFSSYDIKLPRSSAEMASFGSKVDAQNAQKGDLIFFKTRGSGRINHVGMVVEVLEGEIKFIHSASHGGVIISSTKESYYQRNLAQINRVL